MTPEALEEAVAEAIMGEFRNDEDSWSMMERMARAALAVVREKMPVVAWADLQAAAKPFQDAAEDIDDDVPDRSEMWEHPASMNVTAGDFRRIAAIWPNGCRDAASCLRHGQCMYAKCRHEGKSVAASPLGGDT